MNVAANRPEIMSADFAAKSADFALQIPRTLVYLKEEWQINAPF